jgi:hypothetical protein
MREEREEKERERIELNWRVLIATCKQLVWSNRIGRNMPIWVLFLILGSGPVVALPLEVIGCDFVPDSLEAFLAWDTQELPVETPILVIRETSTVVTSTYYFLLCFPYYVGFLLSFISYLSI